MELSMRRHLSRLLLRATNVKLRDLWTVFGRVSNRCLCHRGGVETNETDDENQQRYRVSPIASNTTQSSSGGCDGTMDRTVVVLGSHNRGKNRFVRTLLKRDYLRRRRRRRLEERRRRRTNDDATMRARCRSDGCSIDNDDVKEELLRVTIIAPENSIFARDTVLRVPVVIADDNDDEEAPAGSSAVVRKRRNPCRRRRQSAERCDTVCASTVRLRVSHETTTRSQQQHVVLRDIPGSLCEIAVTQQRRDGTRRLLELYLRDPSVIGYIIVYDVQNRDSLQCAIGLWRYLRDRQSTSTTVGDESLFCHRRRCTSTTTTRCGGDSSSNPLPIALVESHASERALRYRRARDGDSWTLLSAGAHDRHSLRFYASAEILRASNTTFHICDAGADRTADGSLANERDDAEDVVASVLLRLRQHRHSDRSNAMNEKKLRRIEGDGGGVGRSLICI